MNKPKKSTRNVVLPAEWAPQSAVMLTWPHEATDWLPILPQITRTYITLSLEIALRERLVIVTPHPDEVKRYLMTAIMDDVASGAMDAMQVVGNIHVIQCPTNDTWARDHGFITLVDKEKKTSRLLDFGFNGWGDKFESSLDNAINRCLYGQHLLQGEYVDYNDFILEGGSIESDGDGTIFTTTGCLMAPHRNQPLSQEEIEEELKRRLHAERIVWIDHGHLIGDDTDGHIDTLVRIAPADTILYVGCDDEDDEQYSDLKKMEEELRCLQTMRGRGYRLIRLPMPRPVFHEGERLPATYANFLVINGAVLYPTYGQPDKDAEAAEALADAFPEREIVGIDSSSVIVQHGSLHCCTMQFPEGVL